MQRAFNRLRASALIFLYHRVAELESDPFEQALTPQRFEEHVEVLKKYAHPISLTGLFAALSAGRVPRRSVVITFDDGYADNLYTAMPILEKHGVPATVFVSTSPVRTQTEFFWDTLERIFLGSTPIPNLSSIPELDPETSMGCSEVDFPICDNSDFRDWRFADEFDPTLRHRFISSCLSSNSRPSSRASFGSHAHLVAIG